MWTEGAQINKCRLTDKYTNRLQVFSLIDKQIRKPVDKHINSQVFTLVQTEIQKDRETQTNRWVGKNSRRQVNN